MVDVYDKNVLEFATVAAEYCGFVEKSSSFSKASFLDKSQKLLSLLYLKASILPESTEYDPDVLLETFVSEIDWQQIQNAVSGVIGRHDVYFEATDPEHAFNSEEYTVCISECYADIYQDLQNFVSRYKIGEDDIMQVAIVECQNSFKSFWGSRVLSLLQEQHILLYSDEDLSDDEGSSEYNNFDM